MTIPLTSVDLDGEWLLRWSDGCRGGQLEHADKPLSDASRWIVGRVPGDVHLDLEREGLIQDVRVGLGALQARWVEEMWWSYRRTFTVDEAVRSARAWLVFDGLELQARIILNGIEVGRHGNALRPCRLDVTQALVVGENVLVVHVESGLFEVADKPAGPYMGGGFDQRLHKRHWMRRVQSQFGWDWAPRLLNVGIAGAVRLEWTQATVVMTGFTPLARLETDLTSGSVVGRLAVECLSKESVTIAVTLGIDELGIVTQRSVVVAPGSQIVEIRLDVLSPELWWPRGHGHARLYRVTASIADSGSTHNCTAQIGFRHIAVKQDELAGGGRTFCFAVNHRAIFAKGANWIPADLIQARIDAERYRRLLAEACAANFNFIRVWGGGLYESDEFYRMCDAEGILVWQEFCFTCSKYPASDETFHHEVTAEVVANVRRLAGHASLVAWCGNNEIEMGLAGAHWDRGAVTPDYGLFHHTIPRLLRVEDPDRHYQPSSPFSPDLLPANDNSCGDQHPWSVGIHGQDFRDYRRMTCRFASEGGFLGPTSLATMLGCLPEGRQTTSSFHWQQHDNAIASWAEPNWPDQAVTLHLGKDIRAMTPADYCYWGGLLQGEALREFADTFRRRMPLSAGAVFWMFNDCWPATRSWSIVDYHLRRTPSFHAVRRAFAPLHVVLTERDDQIDIIAINEGPSVTMDLRYGLLALGGGYPYDRSMSVVLGAQSTEVIASFPRAVWSNLAETMAFATVHSDGILVARNRLMLPLAKEMAWRQPKIDVEIDGTDAVFRSSVFVWGVCLDLDGERPMGDNFFDLYPGLAHRVRWPHAQMPVILGTGNLVPV